MNFMTAGHHTIGRTEQSQNSKLDYGNLTVVDWRLFFIGLGSKCDIFEIASKFGISKGSVSKYQQQITKAIKSLKQQYINWPQGLYKAEVKKSFEDVCGFPNVIGAIDGTHISL